MAKKRNDDGVYLRGKTYWLDFQHDGQRYQFRLGRGISKTVAKELAKAKRGEVLKGEAGIGRKRRITFDQAKKLFLEWSETNRKPYSVKMHRSCLKKLGDEFGGKRLNDISRFAVEKYKSRRAKEARVRTNRELQTLKSLFNRCIEWGKFEGANPVVGVKLLKEPRRRLRFLSHDEETQLLAVAAEPLRTVVLVGIHAGLRVASECLTLQWGNVDLVRRLVTVEDAHAKNHEHRSVPLNRAVFSALEKLRDAAPDLDPDAPVFIGGKGTPLKSIRTSLATACRNAKLSGVTPHTLRHTFASRLVMAGVDLRTVQELGGWKELKMVERYSHLSPEHKADAVEKTLEETPGDSAGQPKKKSLRYSLHSGRQSS